MKALPAVVIEPARPAEIVASRGELVARLFADHYQDQPAGTATITLDPA